MNGFSIATLKIPGVIDITLEMSDGPLEKRIAEVNAQLRFKHKISSPAWDIRKIGEESTPRRSAKKKEPEPQVQAEKPKRKATANPLPESDPKPAPEQDGPRRPNRPTRPAPVEREGSIAGEIDIAAARRLARS